MKTLHISNNLILMLFIIIAISFTSCKKETIKDNTTNKEEQVSKTKNGEEFVGTWSYENGEVLKIDKYQDLFVLSVINQFGRKDQSYAYKYEERSLKGNDIIFYNSVRDCIYFRDVECDRMKK